MFIYGSVVPHALHGTYMPLQPLANERFGHFWFLFLKLHIGSEKIGQRLRTLAVLVEDLS